MGHSHGSDTGVTGIQQTIHILLLGSHSANYIFVVTCPTLAAVRNGAVTAWVMTYLRTDSTVPSCGPAAGRRRLTERMLKSPTLGKVSSVHYGKNIL